MVVTPRRLRVSNLSKKAQRNRQHVRAVMEAAERRILLTSYTVNPVWTFDNGTDGAVPQAGLIADSSGNLYGTTTNASGSGFKATVFEIPAGTSNLTTLHTFTFDSGNGQPNISPLVSDGNGHLFGTTNEGGVNGEGSVFEVDITGSSPVVTTIASFDPNDNAVESGIQGALPLGKLAVDGSGNIYGATYSGGSDGDGSIFEIPDPTGGSPTIHTLASFDNTDNGESPQFGVVYYNGALYGSSETGPANGPPEIYKYDIGSQQLTEYVSFANDTDEVAGGNLNDVIVDSNGNLFTSSNGGVHVGEEGTIFEIPAGTTTHEALVTFDAANGDPNGPVGALTIGPDGNIYGTTTGLGNTSNGDIFEVNATTHAVSSLGSLDDSTTGSDPNGGLLFLNNNIYGTTSSGGADHDGTVFDVVPVPQPTKLAFAQQPTSSQVASDTITSSAGNGAITVDIEDANGDLISNDNSAVTLSVASPGGTSFGTGSILTVNAVNGVATFNDLILDKAGTYTLTAADMDNGTALTAPTNATQFTITHSTAAKLVFATGPSSTSTNTVIAPHVVVDVEDIYGNLVTDNITNVTLSAATGGSPTLSGNSVAAVAGVATFPSLSIATAGTYTLAAADSSLTGATSTSFQITGPFGAASKLVFAVQPVSITAGETESGITVTVEDANGNTVVTDNSAVTLSVASGPGAGSTLGTATVANGVATFSNLTFTTAGTYTLSATDNALGAATSNSFVVAPVSTASSLNVTNTPTISPGNPSNVDTALEDQYGNVESGDNSSQVFLNILNPDGSTTTLGPVTVTNGVATFAFSPTAPGNYSFSGSSGNLTFNNVSTPITLTYTSPTLVFAQPIGTVTAGQKLSNFNITVFNASGVVTNAKPKVTLAILSGPSGSKIYGPTKVTAKGGTALFKGVYFKKAGTYQLAVNATGFATGTSTTFVVVPAAPKKLAFSEQVTPNPVASSSAFATDVAVVDAYGNAVSNSDVVLSLKSQPHGASAISGVLSEVTVNGTADFAGLTLTTPGNYTLQATDGKPKAVSKKFVVS
ncbi:MAG TPA: choice-of-anchor tandem repeat GloVer-containing protein [Tepidisphaeraceae bacterium]|jgi:hypothetical protein